MLGCSEKWSQVMFLRHCLTFDLVRRNDVGFGASGESRLGWCVGELRVIQVSGLVATWLICFPCTEE